MFVQCSLNLFRLWMDSSLRNSRSFYLYRNKPLRLITQLRPIRYILGPNPAFVRCLSVSESHKLAEDADVSIIEYDRDLSQSEIQTAQSKA
ncbi:hypothetical protein SAMN04487895_105151 [Paenibacillus sophorae]|uniref:Uncharacterized protein n=1 Tax=Paenibacillus sophorae TaxID=1333845 RepID=A0A1H8MAN7_9BACL|nr:hypothetical protein SAMN04487895_105151 [Paenibacillus sophorae]